MGLSSSATEIVAGSPMMKPLSPMLPAVEVAEVAIQAGSAESLAFEVFPAPVTLVVRVLSPKDVGPLCRVIQAGSVAA